MAYSTEQDIRDTMMDLFLPSSLNFAKYIAKADARINSVMRNFFTVPLVSGSVNTDTWAIVNGLSADLASAFIRYDLATGNQDDAISKLAQYKEKIVEETLDDIKSGKMILAGATAQTDESDGAVVPSILYQAPDEYSVFSDRDAFNIDLDARNGRLNPKAPVTATDSTVQLG